MIDKCQMGHLPGRRGYIMKYLILIILISFEGCIPGPKDLGAGYILSYNTNALDRVILIDNPQGGVTLTYFEDSNKIVKYFKNETPIVDSYVSNSVFNEKFILIDQKPMDSICECTQNCLEKKYPNHNNLPTYRMCEDAIKNAKLHLYYIIDKKSNILYGPMNKNKFSYYLEILKIDKNLKL